MPNPYPTKPIKSPRPAAATSIKRMRLRAWSSFSSRKVSYLTPAEALDRPRSVAMVLPFDFVVGRADHAGCFPTGEPAQTAQHSPLIIAGLEGWAQGRFIICIQGRVLRGTMS